MNKSERERKEKKRECLLTLLRELTDSGNSSLAVS